MNKEAKMAYPIILHQDGDGYYVEIPDFGIGTQGDDVADAMRMARDAIGIMGISMEDEGKVLPTPGTGKREENEEGDINTLVDVDFLEYRRLHDNRSVRKNCTIPYWMSIKADEVGVNYSRVLQEALTKTLGLQYNMV